MAGIDQFDQNLPRSAERQPMSQPAHGYLLAGPEQGGDLLPPLEIILRSQGILTLKREN